MIRSFASILAFLGLSTSAVTVLWDANPETNIAGYRVYLGKASRSYDTVTEVGRSNGFLVTSISLNLTQWSSYLAVTAFDSNGLESAFSSELVFTCIIRLRIVGNAMRIEHSPAYSGTYELLTSVSAEGPYDYVGDFSGSVLLLEPNERQRFFRVRVRGPP